MKNERKYCRNPEILAANLNGETVMMELHGGKYYNIGEIGGRIWALLDTPKTIEELVTELMKEYEVEKEQCRADIAPFLHELEAHNLIKSN